MPAQDGLGADQQEGQRLWREAAGGAEQRAVVRLEDWPLYLAVEDVQLLAENYDLDLLASS